MRLEPEERIISLMIVDDGDNSMVLTATENGYGKCTVVDEYPTKGRGTKGVKSIQTSARNGSVVGSLMVSERDEIMLITDGGTLVRTRVSEVSVLGRNTQGVTLMRLGEGEKPVGVQRVAEVEESGDDSGATSGEDVSSSGRDTGDDRLS